MHSIDAQFPAQRVEQRHRLLAIALLVSLLIHAAVLSRLQQDRARARLEPDPLSVTLTAPRPPRSAQVAPTASSGRRPPEPATPDSTAPAATRPTAITSRPEHPRPAGESDTVALDLSPEALRSVASAVIAEQQATTGRRDRGSTVFDPRLLERLENAASRRGAGDLALLSGSAETWMNGDRERIEIDGMCFRVRPSDPSSPLSPQIWYRERCASGSGSPLHLTPPR